jgi:hypothetical protein
LVNRLDIFRRAHRPNLLADLVLFGPAYMLSVLEPTSVFAIPPRGQAAIIIIFVSVPAGISVTETVISIPISDTVIPIPITNRVVTVTITARVLPVPVPAQILAVAGRPAFIFTQLSPILANVAIAKAVVPVAAQVFAVAGKSALILAQRALVVAHVAVAAIAGGVETAGAFGDFVRAHGLEPVDTVGQFGAVDTLVRPSADDLSQAGGQWRPGH